MADDVALPENQSDADGQQSADKQVSTGDSGSEVVNELDALLGEVDTVEADKDVKPEQDDSDLQSQFSDLKNDFQEMKDTNSRADSDTALATSVDNIIAAHDHLTEENKEIVEGYLRLQADKEPKIRAAFFNQRKDPGTWAKLEKALGDNFANSMKAPDSTVTAAKTAAREAAQGITTTQSSDDEDTGPSQAEMNKAWESGNVAALVQEHTGYRRH